MSKIEFLDKPPTDGSPYKKITLFKCRMCHSQLSAHEYFAEWGDLGDGDSLDLTCDCCGCYYKKTWKIPQDLVISEWYEKDV